MKKRVTLLAVVALMLGLLVGCGGQTTSSGGSSGGSTSSGGSSGGDSGEQSK